MVLEGTYPFVHGGVSSWVHELICNQQDLTFYLVCIVPPGFKGEPCFKMPDNIKGMQVIPLGYIRKNHNPFRFISNHAKEFFKKAREPLRRMVKQESSDEDFKRIVSIFDSYRDKLDHHDLMNSEYAWDVLIEIYSETMPEISFIDFFWSWRTLIGGLFSMMMAEVPPTKCIHSICTGYAGILLARLKADRGTPCILTEHGIYTTERRFEIAFADWLIDQKTFSMSVNKKKQNYELRDLWTDFFVQYGRICYQASDAVISLFSDNKNIQISGGADPAKCSVIPNGINIKKFGSIIPSNAHGPTVAFIGRIVPIKDVKTYIRAISLLSKNVPDLTAYIIGGYDEDPEYYHECLDLIEEEYLTEIIKLTGKADIVKYLPEVDVVVLSSISEAQPLVLLEAGAAGIPSVATNVGSCREILEGFEGDNFGQGGVLVPLSSPQAIADALSKLLLDDKFHASCSEAIKKRVYKYYRSEDQFRSYHDLYTSMIKCGSSLGGNKNPWQA